MPKGRPITPELDFFVNPGWQPRIRPASSTRTWMDATAERFAYRCLPLAIANAHGWELLSPCGFEARWNGESGPDGVEIRLDEGAVPRQAPVSLFGQGTVTFHVEAIIRTSPGWNLWVGGSPNAAKDGISPLGGVIETDWSPYSFTMNWRFTRPGHWIRFDEDEPFCFLFPIERGPLQAIEPRIRSLDEAPELKASFHDWSRSRDAFHERMRQNPPSAPADKWQKLYYRGLTPDGVAGTDHHNAKLKVQPVVNTTRAEQCPAAGAHRAKPSTVIKELIPSGISIDDQATVSTLHGSAFAPVSDDVNAHVIPEIDPLGIAAPSQHEAERLVAPESVGTALATLARRDWLLDIAERQRALCDGGGEVPRVRGLDGDTFLERYYAPGRPVVIEGAIDDWPAHRDWTPESLAAKVGAAPIEFQGGRNGSGDFELYKDDHRRVLPFDEFIRMITTNGVGNDAYLTAYNSERNRDALAPLTSDLGEIENVLTPGSGMLWIGPAGTFTPLHFDLTNNLLAQVVGTKQLVLAPPSETQRLYNRRHVFSDVHDLTDPVRLDLYPLARNARTIDVELNAGDLLYIPVGWWHQVVSLEFSVMLTYTNFRWANDAYASFPAA